MFITRISVSLALLASLTAGQASAAPPATLDDYVRAALTHNADLRQRELEVDRAGATRDVARGAYLPSIDLSFRYTWTRGADLDIGDFINPAYGALNQLLGQPTFPTDVSLALPLHHETRVRLTQPLFHPEIYYGNRLADLGIRGAALSLATARRELIAVVKATYWAHARAALVEDLLGRTRLLLEENLRVSELLVAQGKATDETVLRARAELAELDQQRREVVRARGDAARYLAFLTGAEFDDTVALPAAPPTTADLPPLAEAEAQAVAGREELRLVSLAGETAATEARRARSAYLPTLGLALDYGFQGNDVDYSFDKDTFSATVLFEWNLWRGFRDKHKVRVATIAREQASARRAELERQVRLQVRQAWNEADTARLAIGSAAARVESARAAYDIVARRYAADAAPQIELLEARTTLTRAETDQILAFTEFQTKLALLERAAATAELDGAKEVTR